MPAAARGLQAGLLAGLLALGHGARVIGIDVDAQPERVRADVCRVGREAAALLGIADRWRDDAVEVAGEWSAGAYGVADAVTEEAMRLAARTEGLVVDPVYAGKGMAGLIGSGPGGSFRTGRDGGVGAHGGLAGGVRVFGDDGAGCRVSAVRPRVFARGRLWIATAPSGPRDDDVGRLCANGERFSWLRRSGERRLRAAEGRCRGGAAWRGRRRCGRRLARRAGRACAPSSRA